MTKSKPLDIRIKVAIIGALGAIAAAYVGSPLLNTQHQERPIIEWSFAANNTSPQKELEQDAAGYFINLFSDNRGKSDGKIIFEVRGTHAQISFSPDLPKGYDQSLRFTIPSVPVMRPYKIHVIPDANASMISFELLAQDTQDKPAFEEENPYIPLNITYQLVNGKYELTR
jgi:hypothetical protein